MFTYTKKELRLLALSLTLFVLLIYNLVLFPLINSIFNLDTNKIYSNYVYSKTIPIQKAYQMPDATIYKSIIQKDASLTEVSDVTNEQPEQKQEESKKADVSKPTQRDVIKENKNIKWRIQIPKIDLDVHIM